MTVHIFSASSPPKPRKAVNDLEVIEEAVANIPGMDLGDTLAEDFDLDFCFDSVEQLEKSAQKSLNRLLLFKFCMILALVVKTFFLTFPVWKALRTSILTDKIELTLPYLNLI